MESKPLRRATLVFLIKEHGDTVTDVCLAMKKRGFGAGRWNGAGGKVEPGETVEAAAAREAREEINVSVGALLSVAKLTFCFPHKPEWNQVVHVFLSREWNGKPEESEEMRPQWFSLTNIPFNEMWADDPLWLPRVLNGETLTATFTFTEDDRVLAQSVTTTGSWR